MCYILQLQQLFCSNNITECIFLHAAVIEETVNAIGDVAQSGNSFGESNTILFCNYIYTHYMLPLMQ